MTSSERGHASVSEPDVRTFVWVEIPVTAKAIGGGPAGKWTPLRPAAAFVVAATLWWSGHPLPAGVVAAVAVGVVAVHVLGPKVSSRLEELIAQITRPIATVAAALVAGALQLLVFTPVALMARVLGRDLLRTAQAGSYWVDREARPGRDLQRRQFAIDVPPAGATRSGGVFGLVRSTVVILSAALVLNLSAGLAVERLTGAGGQTRHYLPLDAPALAGQPWVVEFDAEFLRLRGHWDPMMGFVRNDFAGRHINIRDMARHTYAPSIRSDVERPQVFFFGGSTTFGTGQRDLHTIPSEVARLAAADGQPVEVVNYGQSGFVIWQEVELLERLLTTGNVPDVAVFYDGANEISTQISELSDEPGYPQVPEVRSRLRGEPLVRRLYDSYARHSAIHKLRNRIRGRPTQPPAPTTALTEARARNAANLHGRAVGFVERLADAYGFRAVFFWQPTVFDKDAGEEAVMSSAETNTEDWGDAYRAATTQISEPVIDLTDVLDGIIDPVFFDRVHTNEQGATAVAEAMYAPITAAIRGT